MKSLSLSVPYVIAMIGQPGTGKTHFAKLFTENFNMPVVNEGYFLGFVKHSEDGTVMAAVVLHEIMKSR